ncbi:insulinase family protein [Enterovibrio calviensis]|uniref:insulinase family protein n=1 Tax=Enterovibrio calviensis TaxID=91359 RepID=UPI000484887D|nr:insulinase family protein [Enterovibrio calviensis]
MAKPHPAAPDWILLSPKDQQLDTGWVGYRHVSGMVHWHHAASDDNRLSASLVVPTPVEDDSGITHALEHMVLRGSMRFPERETFFSLRSELALLEFNASTKKESTRFHLSGYDPHSALRGIGFFADSVLSPQLTLEDFEQEIFHPQGGGIGGTLYREINEYMGFERFRASTVQAANSVPRAALFGGMPDTVTQLDIAALRRYHHHYYRPENILLLTAGSWPMVPLWRQMSKALEGVSAPFSVTLNEQHILSSVAAEKDDERIETLSLSPHWAAVLHTTLSSPKYGQLLSNLGAQLLPLNNDFQPAPALRFRASQQCSLSVLERLVDLARQRLSPKRTAWQSGYFKLQQGQSMATRWGDGLQRLYHHFSTTPFAPPHMKGEECEPLPSFSFAESPPQGEWVTPCPPLARLAILCRFNARDTETRADLTRWLALCEQRTLRWAWMQSKPILGEIKEWHCANAVVKGLMVDLPESDVVALRHFWHHSLSANEIHAMDAEWQHTAQGIVLNCAGSVPVFRAGTIMASHRDDETAMHVALSFPHTTEAGTMAALGQAVMASYLLLQRRLGGRCYSLSVSLDLMSYELTFDSVADSDPSISFIALLNAFETLCSPLDDGDIEKVCSGGMGLVSARYNKSHARFHQALLNTVGRSVALDFSVVSPASLAQLATQVLYALKHTTLH